MVAVADAIAQTTDGVSGAGLPSRRKHAPLRPVAAVTATADLLGRERCQVGVREMRAIGLTDERAGGAAVNHPGLGRDPAAVLKRPGVRAASQALSQLSQHRGVAIPCLGEPSDEGDAAWREKRLLL